MRSVMLTSLFVCVLFSCLFASAQNYKMAAGAAGPNAGGFTEEITQESSFDMPVQMGVPDASNNRSFKGENVAPQGSVSSNAGNDSWSTPGSSYLVQKPADYGQLSDTSTTPGFNATTTSGIPQGPNILWIVDSTGLNRYPEMSIPLNGYAWVEITPSSEGQITIEEMYPDGKVHTYGMGYVRPYHVYKMWFYGDVPGTHMWRYNINGYYSNIIRFYVQGSGDQGGSKPVAGVGATVSRTGSTIVRRGGSYSSSSSGYSSMSSSGGSMSVSTSFG